MTKTAYCAKCKKKVEIENPRQEIMKNGNGIIKGTCPNCLGNVSVFGKLESPAVNTSVNFKDTDLPTRQLETNNPEKKLIEEIKREIEQAPAPIEPREEEYYQEPQSEEEEVKDYQEVANNNPLLQKHHKEVVDTRTYGFFKIIAVLFILIIALLVIAIFMGYLKTDINLSPDFTANVSNQVSINNTANNNYQINLNATIVMQNVNVNAKLNLSNVSG